MKTKLGFEGLFFFLEKSFHSLRTIKALILGGAQLPVLCIRQNVAEHNL